MKRLIVIALLTLVAGAGVFTFLNKEDPARQTSQPQQSSASTQVAITPGAGVENSQATSANGKYIDYDENTFNSTPGKKILFFHAPWCGQCRSIESGIVPGSIPDNTTIFKVDYDSRQDVRKTYGVTMRTSFVVLNDGGQVTKKYVAYDDPYFDSVKREIF